MTPVHIVAARARLRSADQADVIILGSRTTADQGDVITPGSRTTADQGDVITPGSRTTRYSQRSFCSSAPTVWDELPSELKDGDISR